MYLLILSVCLNYRKSTIILMMLLCAVVKVNAQDQKDYISYGFKQDTVSVKAGNTFINAFWIENKADFIVKLVRETILGQEKTGLLRLPDTIALQPKQKRFFPLKYMADRQTIRNSTQAIKIKLLEIGQGKQEYDPGKKNLVETAFYAQLEDIQGVFIDTDQQEVYLNQLTNQARVMVRVFNNGLIPVSFRLELTEIPDGLDFIGETVNLTLEPGAQQSLPFLAKNKLNSHTPADFAVTIRALDNKNNPIAVKRLRIMSISSDRRLSANQAPFYQNKPNTVALRYMTIDKSLSMYQLQGNGKYELGKDQQISYQANIDYYDNPDQKGFNVYDSYIAYQNKEWGTRIGNIYESLDFNLNGRGIKGIVYVGNKRSLSVYAVDNNYLLFSQFNKLKLGNTFAVAYKEESLEANNKQVVVLRSNNLLTGINTTLVSSNANIKLDQHQNIGFDAAYSKQDYGTKSLNGLAAGASYNLDYKRFNFYSSNYYSSPYYDGLRKGLLQLENRVVFAINENKNLNARFNIVENRPKVLAYADSAFIPVTNNYGNATYELGYANRIGLWSFNIKPYYFTQHMTADNEGRYEKDVWKSASIRTKFNINYSNNFQDLSFEMDNGYTYRNTSEKPPAPFFSSRMNLSYRNSLFGFSAFAQFNSYYLTDALAISGNPKYSIYSFGPNTHFALFEGQLTVNASAMYNYYGFNQSRNYSLNSNVRWLLKGNWAISADIFYSLNKINTYGEYNPVLGMQQPDLTNKNSYTSDNRQLRIGIEKSFGSSGHSNNGKLELVYFEDRNGNGHRDSGESLATGILVKTEGIAAITNNKGTVIFTAEKNKTYSVSIVNDKGWSLLESTDVFLIKNIKLEIPLVKTERVTGSLKYIADKYTEGEPVLGGIRIKAIAEGGKVFSTITNEQGLFNFYLPENKYTVSVETNGMPFSIINQREELLVKRNSISDIVFKYKDEQRKVEIVKFK
ncbi:hypothetical protein H7F33_09500 [Pedobacter sp. PAMC26386]|nr:hypothetical protein H7F33_09500 [Pedobacter sp. PAMC26386]